MTVTVPPLRDGRAKLSRWPGCSSKALRAALAGRAELSVAAIEMLKGHSWPETCASSGVQSSGPCCCAGPVVEPAHLTPLQRPPPPRAAATAAPPPPSERARIERALSDNGWNQAGRPRSSASPTYPGAQDRTARVPAGPGRAARSERVMATERRARLLGERGGGERQRGPRCPAPPSCRPGRAATSSAPSSVSAPPGGDRRQRALLLRPRRSCRS